MTPHSTSDDQLAQSAAPAEASPAGNWSIADAAELYGVHRWGRGYLSINDTGHVMVHPHGPTENGTPSPGVDLCDLVEQLSKRDLQPPVLIRFTDILRHRLGEIAGCFGRAIKEFDYGGSYRCVYPIKVNQQRQVVEEVLAFGREHGFGLEVGSKPELLAVLAMVDDPETPIICNGFKDDHFIQSVILATKLGQHVIPVVEKFSELKLIVQYASQYGVKPQIGIRAKLAARGAGRWENSGGIRSKFGLFISEILDAVEYLKAHDMLDCLKLVHFHLGSQINSIRHVKAAITEQARIYTELHRLGAGIEYVDVGGGLGVDYDGSKTTAGSSINYSLQEYANDIVYHIREVCDGTGAPHPNIISESGRAMVAYHTALVFNVVGWSGFDRFEIPKALPPHELDALPRPVRTLFETNHDLDATNFAEYYHDAQLARDEARNLFNLGFCDLEHRAMGERLYFAICSKVYRYARKLEHMPEEFQGLERLLSDTYFCNCSVFQSLPDSWAIDQVFPIMPIHQLDTKPTCKGILADITCDSDGKIDHFIPGPGQAQPQRVLDLHPYDGGDYYLAAFLAGAYQEILGDLHNLLGDTHVVHVTVDETGEASIEEVVEGDSVAEVLRYVQFNPEELRRMFRRSVERAVRAKRLSLDESQQLRRFFEQGLAGYTYLT